MQVFPWMVLFLVMAGERVGWATHDVEHRFTLYGCVSDEAGKPLSGVTVAATHLRGSQKASTVTRGGGYYEVLLHLHNDNLGDEVEVVANGQAKKIRAQFSPTDHSTERRGEVNFGGSAGGCGDFPWLWFGVGSAVVVLGGMTTFFVRKRMRVARASAKKQKKQR